MNRAFYLMAVVVLVLVAVLVGKIFWLSGIVEAQGKNNGGTITALEDSIATLQRRVDTLAQHVPGLGEYMTTVQLHMAKLWYAEQSSNWELCSFELGELTEAIQGGEALHAVRNKVNITGVLESVRNSQLQLLHQSIDLRQQESFVAAYSQTLDACNSCHRSAGYGYIRIITPTSPPVTNQRWTPGG